jgi:hypothetical protein
MTTKDVLALALEALEAIDRADLELSEYVNGNLTSLQNMLDRAITAIKQAQDVALINEGDMPQAITPETGNAATPLASAITAGNGQAQEPDHPGACKTCGNTYLASRTDVHKDKRPFIYCDCCGAMADSKTWYLTHGPAPNQAEPEQ